MPDVIPIRKSTSIFDEIRDVHNRVMQRAYELFEHNGGLSEDNWLQAEHELVWKPALELRETDGRLVLEVAISGVDPKNLDIEITPEDIVMKADIQHEHRTEKGTVHICEFQVGKLFRSIHLPRKINPDKVKAEMKNGLLRLTAEVAEEARVQKEKPEAA